MTNVLIMIDNIKFRQPWRRIKLRMSLQDVLSPTSRLGEVLLAVRTVIRFQLEMDGVYVSPEPCPGAGSGE